MLWQQLKYIELPKLCFLDKQELWLVEAGNNISY